MAVVLHLSAHTFEHKYTPRSLKNGVSGPQVAPYLAPHSGCESELCPLRGTLGSRQPLVSLLSLATADRGNLSCYCFWLPVGFSWPASMDGTFTSLGLPWELSPSPPRTPPAEGTHPLPPLLLPTDILTTLYSIWTLVTHIAYSEFPSFYLIPAFSLS